MLDCRNERREDERDREFVLAVVAGWWDDDRGGCERCGEMVIDRSHGAI